LKEGVKSPLSAVLLFEKGLWPAERPFRGLGGTVGT
ncbi:MAG: hypothetical protein RI973_1977, partial [Bacteroidota bacterium]